MPRVSSPGGTGVGPPHRFSLSPLNHAPGMHLSTGGTTEALSIRIRRTCSTVRPMGRKIAKPPTGVCRSCPPLSADRPHPPPARGGIALGILKKEPENTGFHVIQPPRSLGAARAVRAIGIGLAQPEAGWPVQIHRQPRTTRERSSLSARGFFAIPITL